MAGAATVRLSGDSLSLGELVRIARDPRVKVELDPAGLARVALSGELVARIATDYRDAWRRHRDEGGPVPVSDYGVTTGFGEFKDRPIPPDELAALQRNILLSHAAGAGSSGDPEDPAGYYPAEVVRAVLALRLNTFLKGHSGLRPEMVQAVAAMLERGIVPRVPVHGSVGSSGDLCPLAHLFLPLVGEGEYWLARRPEELQPSYRPELRAPARQLAADLGLAPPAPTFKEGLGLINGATFSAALLALAVHDAEVLAATADVAAALSLEGACGCARAFDPKVHAARGQLGQIESAGNLRRLLAGSRLIDSAGEVQDPYSLRAAPAVHGASRDAIAYARAIAEREANAATDNPLFFPGDDGAAHREEPWDLAFRGNWPESYAGDRKASYSASNFHGQPVALAADFLAIALAELASISERRTQLLLDRHYNRGLPANLVPAGGVNSGLMIVQYTAAGLVSENKVLAHPASVDSIPTSANVEDHNSMATVAARKLRTVLANVQAVVAIELLVAAQAVDWRGGAGVRPRRSQGGQGGEAPPLPDVEAFRAATGDGRREEIAALLGRGTRQAYRLVRRAAAPVAADRSLAADIAALRSLVAEGTLVAEVERALASRLRPPGG